VCVRVCVCLCVCVCVLGGGVFIYDLTAPQVARTQLVRARTQTLLAFLRRVCTYSSQTLTAPVIPCH
jgi:hypothetical protein